MKRFGVLCCSAFLLGACRAPQGGGSAPATQPEPSSLQEVQDMSMSIQSPAFGHNERIPAKFTCDGDDPSPALRFADVPEGAKSLALIMDDPDAPPGTWVHWVVYGLGPEARELPEGLPKTETLSGGAKQGACWGVESFSRVGYYGPCPPPGKPHRYIFKLYALDAELSLAPKATAARLRGAMKGHILAEAELIGLYGR